MIKYYSDSTERQSVLFEWVGHLPYEVIFADCNHFRVKEADIVVIDVAIENVSKEPHQLLVTFPFVLTDLLNAVSLILNHRQFLQIKSDISSGMLNYDFSLIKGTLEKLSVKKFKPIPNLIIEQRFTPGKNGWSDNFSIFYDESLVVGILFSCENIDTKNKILKIIHNLPISKNLFSNLIEKIVVEFGNMTNIYLTCFFYDEDTGECTQRSTSADSFEQDEVNQTSHCVFSYGANKIKKERKLNSDDLLQFSFESTKINFEHDVTIVTISQVEIACEKFKLAS